MSQSFAEVGNDETTGGCQTARMWQPNPWKADNDALQRRLEDAQIAAAGSEEAQRRLRRELDEREARYQRRKPWLQFLAVLVILAVSLIGLLAIRAL